MRSIICPRLAKLLLLVSGTLLLLAAGFFLLFDRESGDAVVRTVQVQRGDIERVVTATGVLEPRDYVDVGAQVSGQLKKLHVHTGSQVESGQLLAEIDPTLFMARVDAYRAQLRAQLAQRAERQAQLQLASLQYQRQQNLWQEDATTRESVQSAQASLAVARAQIEALQAQIEQSQSTLRAEEANLQYARILSPMSGTVVSISARQGQTLNASQQSPVLMRVADLATMTVRAQVSEADVSKLHVGMPVYFTTLGNVNSRWQGTLASIDPTPEVLNNVVLYNALFDVPNPDGLLMTQMTAQVFFIEAQASQALLVPVSALTFEGSARGGERRARVTVLEGRRQTEREVVVGVSNRIQAEVLRGLEEGDVLIGSRQSGAGSARRESVPPGMPRMMR